MKKLAIAMMLGIAAMSASAPLFRIFALDISICFCIMISSFRIRVRVSYGCCVSLPG